MSTDYANRAFMQRNIMSLAVTSWATIMAERR